MARHCSAPDAALFRRFAPGFLWITFAWAASAGAQGLAVDFPEAVSRALKNNAALSAAGFEWRAAVKEADAARGLYLPGLVFEERFVRTNVPAEAFALKINEERLVASDFANVDNFNKPPPINDFITSLTVQQAIFAPKAYLGYKMAGREAEAKGLDLGRQREETVFRVLAAYLDVLTEREAVRVARQAVEDDREHVRIAEARESRGVGLSSDVLRARVFLASAESRLVTAETRLDLSRRGLARAMGEPPGTLADAAGPLPPLPEDGSLEEQVAAALARRPDLGAFAARVENARTNVSFNKSEYLPTVGVTGGYQVDAQDGPFSPDNRSWKVGVGLTWNIFDGLRREASVAKAQALRGQAEARYRGAQEDAAFEVARAYLAVKEADRRREIARASIAAAEEGTRLIRKRYENELARMVDLLDAQSAQDAARVELVRTENDLALSRAQLLFSSGMLMPWALPGTEVKP